MNNIKKPTDKEIANDKVDRIMQGVNRWCSFYRSNPQRFCKDYLNINLKMFQQVILYMMNICTNFVTIGGRGISKSFMCAVFCVYRCILWPGTKIVITAKVRSQAINILDEKIMKILYVNSSNLRMEIKKVEINNQKAEILFKNGSYIKVVTANDNARSARANILICDEFRMIDKEVINMVLKRFLTDSRHPGYLDNPKYGNMLERNKQLYLSSSWFKTHWSWEQCKDYFSMMLDTDKKYFCGCFPYQMGIKSGLLIKEAVEDEMSEATFNEMTFKMEMCGEWIGVTEDGLFSFDDINKTRVIEKAFYPPNIIIPQNKVTAPTKKNGEFRILTADIALMSSKKNDNDATSIFLNCVIPNKLGRCTSNFVYSENMEGVPAQDQALKLRRYFDYFDCDYLGIDARGVGLPIIDLLLRDMYDPDTGETYPGISCCNNEEIAERCPDKNAKKVIWAIMGSATFNSEAAILLRSGFQQNRIHLLQSEYVCESYLQDTYKGYTKMSPSEQIALKMPYLNTGLAVNELVNLGYETNNNVIKVKEKSGCRKDRYSSMSYNYYIAQQIERKIEKKSTSKSKIDFLMRIPVLKKGGR